MTTLLWWLACGTAAVDAGPRAPEATVTDPRKVAASEVLILYRGAADAPASVLRTPDEARALALEVFRRAQAGEPFEALARAHSEGPAAPRGGRLGVWRLGTMLPDLERAVLAVEIGAVAAPFQTPFGWHVVRRDAVIEIEARHILVTWSGAWRAPSSRTRDDALARANAALEALRGGAPFGQIAAEYSDDATARSGGALGTIAPGQLIPAFEDAAFALQVGQRSAIVETPYGFHIIERTR